MKSDLPPGPGRIIQAVRQHILKCSLTTGAVLFCLFFAAGCASTPLSPQRRQLQAAALRDHLLQLDRSVDPVEAEKLARQAVERAAELAIQYRAVKPAWLHNWLVNSGHRERGLCYDWANDLFPALYALGLHSLELHLAVARMDTRREHNSVVVTARQQSLDQGVVLDAWRSSGRLWFGRVATDKYPWTPLPRDRVAPELERYMAN